MNCPHCSQSIPDKAVLSEAGRLSGQRAANPGRKSHPWRCPKCGGSEPSARAGRKHKCGRIKSCP